MTVNHVSVKNFPVIKAKDIMTVWEVLLKSNMTM